MFVFNMFLVYLESLWKFFVLELMRLYHVGISIRLRHIDLVLELFRVFDVYIIILLII